MAPFIELFSDLLGEVSGSQATGAIASAERSGQVADNQPTPEASPPNTIKFQLTAHDAEELAPAFAQFSGHTINLICFQLIAKDAETLAPQFVHLPEQTVSEMVAELTTLPPFTAYAQVLKESTGEQVFLRSKIQTLPLLSERGVSNGDIEALALHTSHRFCKERDEIEAEIRKRQEPWRRGGGLGQSPSQQPRNPPPTSE